MLSVVCAVNMTSAFTSWETRQNFECLVNVQIYNSVNVFTIEPQKHVTSLYLLLKDDFLVRRNV